MKRGGKILSRIVLWTLGILLVLVLLSYILIQLPGVQNLARDKAVTYLREKLGTRVDVARLRLVFPKSLSLEGVYFEDLNGDTLFAGEKLLADVTLFKLLRNRLEINKLEFVGLTANVHRAIDSTYNFDYIIDSLASEKAQPEEEQSKPLIITLKEIALERINLKYRDDPEATNAHIALGTLDVRIKEFDLENMTFDVPEIVLKNSSASFIQHEPLAERESMAEDVQEAYEPMKFDLQLGTVQVDTVYLLYDNAISATRAEADLGTFFIRSDTLNVAGKTISLDALNLANSKLSVVFGAHEEAEVVKEEAAKEVETTTDVWQARLDELNFDNNTLIYDDHNSPPVKTGMDFSHLRVDSFLLHADNIAYANHELGIEIDSAGFFEKSGFELKQLHGDLHLGETEGYARDLFIQTNNSVVDGDIQLRYAHFDSLLLHPTDVYQSIVVQNTTIAMSDLLLIAPDLAQNKFFAAVSKEVVHIEASMDGKLDDLSIRNVHFYGLSHTELKASGSIKGLPDVEKARFNLNIDHLHTKRGDLYAMLPHGTIPNTIDIPADILVEGNFDGSLTAFDGNLNVRTSYGNARLNGAVSLDEPMRFNGKLDVNQFDLGAVMKQDTVFGKVTLTTTANLRNINSERITGTFYGTVKSFEYMKYDYQNIIFNGTANAGTIDGVVSMNDPNLQFDFDGNATLRGEQLPSTTFVLNVQKADLKTLHLLDRPLVLSGKAYADFSSIDPKSLNGTLSLSNFSIWDSTRTVVLDTVYVDAMSSPTVDTLKFYATFADILMTGEYDLATLPAALAQSISKYFEIVPPEERVATEPQKVEVIAEIRYSPIFAQFDTSLLGFSPLQLKADYQSEGDAMNLEGSTELVRYEPATINNIAFNANTTAEALNYNFGWESLKADDISLKKTTLEGKLSDDRIASELTILDSLDKQRFHLNTLIRQSDDQFVISLEPEGLLLNYDNWSASPDNEIALGDGALAIRNFVLSKGSQSLSVRSEPYGFNQPIAFEFNDFEIATITEMINGDSLLAGGRIDGTAMLRNYFDKPVFNADLRIEDLSYRGDTVGNLTMLVNNETANTLAAKVDVEGSGNSVQIDGTYFIQTETIALDMHIERLRLASIQGFSQGAFTEGRGIVHGDLEIKGTLGKPVVEGDLHFDSASVRLTYLNAVYALPNEGLRFTNSDVHFNEFTVADEEGNVLNVNGIIHTRNFTNFLFEIDIDSRNFKVLDTEPKGNDLYYGVLYLDSRVTIRGRLNQPEINADLTVKDNTNMTFVVPQESPEIVEREGVVRFVDLDNPKLDSLLALDYDTLNRSSIQGLVVFSNIKVSDDSEFKIIIDQGNGDYLRLRGNAELNMSIDPSGKISMTGNYYLEEGLYELSFNFVKRRFKIRKGSSITWNGEPTSGMIDITAVYDVEAAPIDLVERQLADATPDEINLYKEKLPFQLLLSLTGTLIKPTVVFDIVLPEGNYQVSPEIVSTVRNRLEQLSREESEVNKQAFALVILNRFVSDDPFRSASGGTSAQSYARQSVSKLLSQQLNDFTANLITGIDLKFDLEAREDYSTGQLQNRTDLNVSASKRLLDDRLNVTVGSNFGLEGTKQSTEKATNIAGDISLEYQLSQDGKYLVRAYRKNEYQVAVEGQVIETGVGFVIQLDYDKFRDIFNSNNEKGGENNQ